MMDCRRTVQQLQNEIDQLKKEIYKLKHDRLTGFGNRYKLEDTLNYIQNIEWDFHPNKSYYVYLIDLDGLHEYNRTYGYKEGDNFITNITNKIFEIIKDTSALPFRIGGDKFVLILHKHDINKVSKIEKLDNITFAKGELTKNKPFNVLLNELDEEIIKKKKERQ